MAKKQETDQNLIELKSKLVDEKVIVGTERVIKMLRVGKLEKVFLAKNCPEEAKEDITKFASLGKVKLELLSLDNEELGVFCKKNFFVSVIGTTK
jgi:ribosomal protein L30E